MPGCRKKNVRKTDWRCSAVAGQRIANTSQAHMTATTESGF